MRKEDKEKIIISIFALVVILIALYTSYSAQQDTKEGIPIKDNGNCTYVWNEYSNAWASVGCLEECGCYVLAEYEVITSEEDAGKIINEIIKNITERNQKQ